MRWVACVCIVVALGSCEEELYFIPGTGTLPNCSEVAVTNLDGTEWYDNGTVTIRTTGCEGAMPGDELRVCGLDWVLTQDGDDVTIVVDEEYRLEGRLCGDQILGDQLFLRGGWWLPVEDELGCGYEEDSAEEVAITAEGNVLGVAQSEMTGKLQMTGTLAVQGNCGAHYEVTFDQK
jgi:hypothetical protein